MGLDKSKWAWVSLNESNLKCTSVKPNLNLKEKPKSKLRLLRVTMGLDKSFNQSLQGGS